MAQAKWLVCVDWNDDGDFSDTNEDVTSDVLGLTLEQFRDLASDHIEAARLELELKNDDHKYSPPNSSSPLSGNLSPGRKVWLRAAYPFDSFIGTAGTQLASHNPDYDSGFTWAEDLQGFDINAAGTGAETDSTQVNGDCVATMDFGDSDASIGCDFTRGTDASDHGGLSFRFSNTSNYLYVRITGTAVEVRKVDAGADSQVATAAHTWSASTTKFLQVGLHGSSIRVFVDDAQVVSTISSFNSTATRHGLFSDDQADHTWDNFGGWVSLFYGVVDSIHPRPRKGAQYCYAKIPHLDKRKTSLEPDAMRAKMFCCTDKPSPTRCTYYEARLTGVPVRRGEEYDGYDSIVGADDVRRVDARSGFEVVGGAPRGSAGRWSGLDGQPDNHVADTAEPGRR